MATNSPKGYKKFGDISEVALEDLNKMVVDSREPRFKRKAKEIIRKSDTHIIMVFPKIYSDSSESNKTFIYLDCINSYNQIIFENTRIENVRHITNFKEELFYMIEFVLD